MPGNPFEFPPNKLVENPGGRTILVSAFDEFKVYILLKYLASTQLFIFSRALCLKFCKDSIGVNALYFAVFMVGEKVGGV